MPRQARAEAISARSRLNDEQPGGFIAFLIRPLLANPKDAIAILVAAAMAAAITGNALFMQAGRHPSPMFGQAATPLQQGAVANPIPRARPLDPAVKPAELRATETRPQAEPKAAEPKAAEPRGNDPMGQLVAKTAAPAIAPVARPPAPIPVAAKADAKADPVANLIASQRRIAAVQRTLTEFGYAQLKPTGVAGSDTQAAIAKFEKERKLAVTGQVSDRMVRELTAVTGRTIE